METAKEYLFAALGGNLNTKSLTLRFWHEVMENYAKYYHKENSSKCQMQTRVMPRPKCLDLFCGQGGAGFGYYKAGFDVTGVDVLQQDKYPFEFHKSDALEFLKNNADKYDFIHGSPPCQGYSHLTPKDHKHKYDKLIYDLRILLIETGKPYCIENVAGAKSELKNPKMLCGSMFGLRTQRHRFFETSFVLNVESMKCNHFEIPLLVTTASKASRELRKRVGMQPKTVKNAPLAYGIDWMDFNGLKESIPPAYTEFIGLQLRILLLTHRAA